MARAATEVIAGSREAARELGISQEEAAAQAEEGVLAAAETLGPEAVAEVREALASHPPADETAPPAGVDRATRTRTPGAEPGPGAGGTGHRHARGIG